MSKFPPQQPSFPPQAGMNNPYQATGVQNYGAPQQSFNQYQFRSIQLAGYFVMALACCLMVCRVFMFVVELIGYSINPNFLVDDAPASDQEMVWILTLAGLGILLLLMMVCQAIAIGFFYYRSSANLHSVGVQGLEHSPGWAVGWWFVPFANLVKPYHVTTEIFQASHAPYGSWKTYPAGLTTVWWGCYIGGNIIDTVISRFDPDPEIALAVSAGTTVLNLAAGACFILIVSKLMRLHQGLKGTQPEMPQQGFGQPSFTEQTPSFGSAPNQGYGNQPRNF